MARLSLMGPLVHNRESGHREVISVPETLEHSATPLPAATEAAFNNSWVYEARGGGPTPSATTAPRPVIRSCQAARFQQHLTTPRPTTPVPAIFPALTS